MGGDSTARSTRGAMLRPGLASQRPLVHRLVHDPALVACDLQHEDVVDVVVRRESARRRGRDIGVDLHGVTELCGEVSRERDHRRPDAVQRLEHDRRAVGEEPRHRRVVHLVGDRRSHPARPCVASGVDDDAVLCHAEERRPQAATREQLVDGLEVEEVVEGSR